MQCRSLLVRDIKVNNGSPEPDKACCGAGEERQPRFLWGVGVMVSITVSKTVGHGSNPWLPAIYSIILYIIRKFICIVSIICYGKYRETDIAKMMV